MTALKGIETLFFAHPFLERSESSNPVTALKGIETVRSMSRLREIRGSNPVTALKGIETCWPPAHLLMGKFRSNPVTALKGIETRHSPFD